MRPRESRSLPLRVAFLHPDLGIGGAERLVVDAAAGLQRKGHVVHMFTSHHDPRHAFDETVNGTLKVTVYGDFLPRHLLGFFAIVFAIIRSLYAAIRIIAASSQYDIIFVDQISVSIPLFRLFSSSKVYFYCHHPDLLLTQRLSLLKKIYRVPFDFLEEQTTTWAHEIAVNSIYTRDVFKRTFKTITRVPVVLYPAIDFSQYVITDEHERDPFVDGIQSTCMIVSINRFERKKNVGLAAHALSVVRSRLADDEQFEKIVLVIAGGYDPRVAENVEYYRELEELIAELGLENNVVFLPSFTNVQRRRLLSRARCLAYTPENEHFGIVPIEAMFAGVPVVACNSGGPLESIVDGETGFLCNPNKDAFADAFLKLIQNENDLSDLMGRKGRDHVKHNFGLDHFSQLLEQQLMVMMGQKQRTQ